MAGRPPGDPSVRGGLTQHLVPQERRRATRALLESAVVSVAVVGGYFVLPFSSRLTATTWLLLVGGLLLVAALLVGFVGAVPFLWLMHHPVPALVVLGQLGFVIALAPVLAIQPALLVESTPPGVRCTVIALGYNMSAGILGGFAPLAATWLVHRSGIDLSPAFIAMAVAAISFAAVLSFRETNPRQSRR